MLNYISDIVIESLPELKNVTSGSTYESSSITNHWACEYKESVWSMHAWINFDDSTHEMTENICVRKPNGFGIIMIPWFTRKKHCSSIIWNYALSWLLYGWIVWPISDIYCNLMGPLDQSSELHFHAKMF